MMAGHEVPYGQEKTLVVEPSQKVESVSQVTVTDAGPLTTEPLTTGISGEESKVLL